MLDNTEMRGVKFDFVETVQFEFLGSLSKLKVTKYEKIKKNSIRP